MPLCAGKATDTSPLVDIKRSVQSIRDEVNAFELRIGVVSHTLMQSKLRMAKHKHRSKRLETKQTEEEDFEDDMEEEDHVY
jgi:estrogen-related receptor beta like 1